MGQIKMLVFDIDGVVTDGKRYISGSGEMKSLSLKDLDAIRQFQESGCKVGCISGEDTDFSRGFVRIAGLELARLGCKEKGAALEEMARQGSLSLEEVCYIGDGKYDLPALKAAGLAVCPADAIDEARQAADVVLARKGGEGCLAEAYTLLTKMGNGKTGGEGRKETILQRMDEHLAALTGLMEGQDCVARIGEAAGMVVDCYRQGGRVFLCGNSGSAADAQHLAGELVGRFYLERRDLDAEALTTNTSILTSLANDYCNWNVYKMQNFSGLSGLGTFIIG